MKLKLKTIWEGRQGLQRVLTYPLEFKLAYQLRKMSGKLNVPLGQIDKKRLEITKKNGESPEGQQASLKEFNEYLEETCNLEIRKIPFHYFAGLQISAFDVGSIEEFIEEPKNETPIKKISQQDFRQ